MARSDGADEYSEACAYARRIALAPTRGELRRLLAQAVVSAKGHGLSVRDDDVVITYDNEFGPTCGVDEQLEGMCMPDWAAVAAHAVRGALALAGDPAKYVPRIRPTVTLTPEEDSDVVRRVTLAFRPGRKLAERLAKAAAAIEEEVRS